MEDDQFPQEDIETIAKNAIVGTLGDCAYNAKKVGDWTNSMTDTILKELQGLNRPFKYVVTTIIMQKNGAGMDTGAAMHWDANKDGLVCIPWENGEMHVVLTIYGVSLNVDNVGDEEDQSRVPKVESRARLRPRVPRQTRDRRPGPTGPR